ncbi:MAG TPA: PadR family transcriptional regulator [Vicinamibacterales bacterium]|nr:PadR family transcriptional regulator [Vicinamibacterales bacterium]
MRRRASGGEGDLLAGTLDMLILRILQAGPAHGLQIAQSIERRSDDVLLVEQGSLYPALYRIEERGWISAYWGVSDSNRKAKFYKLTAAGRTQLAAEENRWAELVAAVGRVLRPN